VLVASVHSPLILVASLDCLLMLIVASLSSLVALLDTVLDVMELVIGFDPIIIIICSFIF